MFILKILINAYNGDILFSSETLNAAYQTMNAELAHVEKWLKLSQLTLNVTKTKYVLFH